MLFLSTACQVQEHFGWKEVGAVDVNATCAGLTYGLHIANGLITSGLHKKILVTAVKPYPKQPTTQTARLAFCSATARAPCLSNGTTIPQALLLLPRIRRVTEPAIYTEPACAATLKGSRSQVKEKWFQNGREVYKWAVRSVPEGVKKLLAQAEMELKDIDWFVPHSANLRMIKSICEKTEIPAEKALTSVEWFGNTSSASIVLALDEAVKNGKLKKGDTLILFGFGGGLTYTGLIVKSGRASFLISKKTSFLALAGLEKMFSFYACCSSIFPFFSSTLK